ncbi:2-oxo acid dehydrogenase subunit E2 [Spongiivirga sp. MCCC 1A20706]|uniref:2-oxo acid dehydrogenase subunit E2 n=1 Tax=Spongiivirga sp. MCCC 1A20706 TaxID=3160963 RepID=UPI0039775A4B
MTELKLPSLGEGIEKGTIISIMVNVGDSIEAEQTLMEVETDKVVVEVPADIAGVVSEILVNIGDEIAENTSIIRLESETASTIIQSTPEVSINEQENEVLVQDTTTVEAATLVKEATVTTVAQTAQINLPSLGEGIEQGTVISIAVKEGDTITAEQTLMEVETDKVVVEVPSDIDGIVEKILVAIGDEISEGTPIIEIKSAATEEIQQTEVKVEKKASEKTVEPKPTIKKEVQQSVPTSSRKGKFRASPLAKKLAREIGVDIATMPVSNPSGRISVKDVKAYSKQLHQNRTSFSGNSPQPTLPDLTRWGDIKRHPMSGIMQATSKNMTTSWSTIPHAWLQEKVDITYLEEKRQVHKNAFKEKGSPLTITGILVKVVAKALEEFPIFNASLDVNSNELIYKDYINIGVAVDTDRGLLVPVLKNADQKNIGEIATDLASLADKVKQKKISAEELDGGTFTISNLGGIGTSAIFPLVSFPQVAILGVAGSQTEASYINGQFQPRLIMPLTIGFDHRIINGADAARFIKHIKLLLEDWFAWNL